MLIEKPGLLVPRHCLLLPWVTGRSSRCGQIAAGAGVRLTYNSEDNLFASPVCIPGGKFNLSSVHLDVSVQSHCEVCVVKSRTHDLKPSFGPTMSPARGPVSAPESPPSTALTLDRDDATAAQCRLETSHRLSLNPRHLFTASLPAIDFSDSPNIPCISVCESIPSVRPISSHQLLFTLLVSSTPF